MNVPLGFAIADEFQYHDISGGSWYAAFPDDIRSDDDQDAADSDVAMCVCGAPLVGNVRSALKAHLAEVAASIAEAKS